VEMMIERWERVLLFKTANSLPSLSTMAGYLYGKAVKALHQLPLITRACCCLHMILRKLSPDKK
jgi:hypothetical protein